MERLTEKSAGYFEYDLVNGNHLAQVFADFDSFLNYNLAVMKLGEYEDAEEDGLLIKVLCNTGDIIYCPSKLEGIFEFQIVKIEIYKDEMLYIDDSDNVWEVDDFGKTVFLTEEAAEAALAKMKGV